MKWKALAAAMLVLFPGSACAFDSPGPRQMFRQMDRNGDRALQFSEIAEARARFFDSMDRNGNGFLDPEEKKAAAARLKDAGRFQAASLEGLEARAERMDANGDGRISREEFARFVPDRLRGADADGNRSLSLSELRALRR
ncbi:EF-hand domain-containing protein [Chelatococcus sp. XZ-Ab1]|uniref:EF-hand domain-containing protein n=1 Tax=Chelatococcus sp. XZ-Ab1 TaxID=3034027 RepID=UPI0023E3EB01|nr:EF-hand domain-containing protein [Chelatococcus sp. XZ-Ab1]